MPESEPVMRYPVIKSALRQTAKTITVICLAIAGIACGQKGSLYLPADTANTEQQCPDKRCKATPPEQHP
ncbi:MAG: lipoprotein [Pseudomonadales bacterium]|nr:lipoprotein [Pseudomonadales bacterium]